MTNSLLAKNNEEIKLALLGNIGEINKDCSNSFSHAFDNAEVFPTIGEWSKYEIGDNNYSFNGIDLARNQKSYVTITMAEAKSGFKNILGKYSVDDQGVIRSVAVLVHNTREAQSGDKYFFNQDDKNENIQFFLIANGQSYNKSLQDSQHPKGSFQFVANLGTDDERLAKITDNPSIIELIYQIEDKIEKVEGNIYHTADPALNHDSKSHSISGVLDDSDDTLRISFEDFPNLGDRDFNDVVFDVSISYGDSAINQRGNLNDISPSGGDTDFNDGNLYCDTDGFFDGMSLQPPFSDDGVLAEGDSFREAASETIDTLIELDNLLEKDSLLDTVIGAYVEKTTIYDPVEHRVFNADKVELLYLTNAVDLVVSQHENYFL